MRRATDRASKLCKQLPTLSYLVDLSAAVTLRQRSCLLDSHQQEQGGTGGCACWEEGWLEAAARRESGRSRRRLGTANVRGAGVKQQSSGGVVFTMRRRQEGHGGSGVPSLHTWHRTLARGSTHLHVRTGETISHTVTGTPGGAAAGRQLLPAPSGRLTAALSAWSPSAAPSWQ